MSATTRSLSAASMPQFFRRLLVGVLVVALQWLILGRLRIWGAFPDVVLLYVAWLGLRHGRLTGSVAGFATGLAMDAIYGTWGVHMFVKTLVGFLVGLFPASERETLLILPQQAFLGALVIALLHNGLMVALMALQSGARTEALITVLWLGSSFYTSVLGTLASLFSTR